MSWILLPEEIFFFKLLLLVLIELSKLLSISYFLKIISKSLTKSYMMDPGFVTLCPAKNDLSRMGTPVYLLAFLTFFALGMKNFSSFLTSCFLLLTLNSARSDSSFVEVDGGDVFLDDSS